MNAIRTRTDSLVASCTARLSILAPAFAFLVAALHSSAAPASAPLDRETRNLHLERCVSATTPLLFLWPGGDSSKGADSAMMRVMAEPEVKKFLEQSLAGQANQFAWFESMKDKPAIEMVGGGYCMRILGQNRSPVPEMVWTFQTASDPTKMLTFWKSMMDGPISAWMRQIQPGIDLRLRPLPDASQGSGKADVAAGPQPRTFDLFYATWGSTFLISTSDAYAREIIASAERQSTGGSHPNGKTLAQSTTYQRVLKALDPDQSSFLAFFNIDGIYAAMPRTAIRAREASGFDGLHAIGFTVTPDERGLEERYYVDAPEPRRGMLKLWEMKRGGIASARFASPKSVVYSNAHMDLPALYTNYMEVMRTTEPKVHDQLESLIRGLEKRVGFSTTEDLAPTLGDELALMASLEAGTIPDVTAAIHLRDPARCKDLLEKAIAVMAPGEPVKTKYLGRDLMAVPVNLKSDKEGLAGTLLSTWIRPHFCVDGDYLLIGLMPQSLKNAIRRADGGQNLSRSAMFQESLAHYGSPLSTGSMTYIDLRILAQYAYGAILTMLQAQSQGGKSGFDLASVPSLGSITRHMFPMTIVGHSDRNGIFMNTHSPFGSAMLMGFSTSLLVSAWTKPIPQPQQVRVARSALGFDESMDEGNIARIGRRFPDALRHFHRALEQSKGQPVRKRGQLHFHFGLVYRETGDVEKSRAHFEKSIELGYFKEHSNYFLATLLAREGKLDQAVEKLELAIDQGWNQFHTLRSDPDLAKLRDRPKYRQLLAKISARDR